MPSYYDSTKQKPGRAKRIYRKGGKVKYNDGGDVTSKKQLGIDKETLEAMRKMQEHMEKLADEKERLEKKYNPRPKREEKPSRLGRDIREQSMAKGGKIEARGSGAARTQYFRPSKNG